MKEYKNMEDFEKRVVDEQQDLDIKISKLDAFVDSQVFETVDPCEQIRLKHQLEIMRLYSDILQDRIVNFMG